MNMIINHILIYKTLNFYIYKSLNVRNKNEKINNIF